MSAEGYTSMPWAIRTDGPPGSHSIAGSGFEPSNPHTTDRSQLRRPPQQLAASDAAQRDAERRVIELEQELSQSRKREEAGGGCFFLHLFKEMQKVSAEHRRFEGREARLEQKYKWLRLEVARLDNETIVLEEKEALFKAQMGSRYASEESESLLFYGNYDKARTKRLGEVNPWSAGKINRHFAMGEPLDIWDGNSKEFCKIEKLLRKHDYYAGWLDAMQVIDHEKAANETAKEMSGWMHVAKSTLKALKARKMPSVYDESHPKNAVCAGLNVGLLFAWSALCAAHDLPQHDVRLDDRTWELADLKCQSEHSHSVCEDFWEGVALGVENMEQLFKLKMASGKWNHCDDPEQVKHMQPDESLSRVAAQQVEDAIARCEREEAGRKERHAAWVKNNVEVKPAGKFTADAARKNEDVVDKDAGVIWEIDRNMREDRLKAVSMLRGMDEDEIDDAR